MLKETRAIRSTRGMILAMVVAVASTPAWAQAPQGSQAAPAQAPDAAALAKDLSNPLASLVSVPFQFNWAQPVGPDGDTRFILNVQPVMPFSVSENWNMIARVIVPIVGQPPLAEGGMAVSGLSDVLTSVFFSPKSSPLVWGVGPVLSLPSTSEKTLGTGKWSAGPTFVVLKQQGQWTYGALVNQVWSFAGNESRGDVSQFYLQPFLAYNTPNAVTFSINSESIFNWKADSGRRATVPINLGVSKVATFGVFPASYQLGAGFYVHTPDGRPDWQVRFVLTLLLPKRN